MRALGYYTVDYETQGRSNREDLARAFARYCEEGRHIPQGTYDEPRAQAGGAVWQSMVDFIRNSGLGYLVVIPGAEHLGSTLESQIGHVLELDALQCQVVCDDADLPDPLQNALKGSGSAAYRRQRIREGMKAKAAKGLGLGKPPYGYRIIADGGFRLVPDEAEVVAAIFKQYLELDGGVRTIAAALNDKGLRTRTGRRWSMVTVRDILRNTAYIGTYRRFGLRIPSSYEPIVNPSDFRRVQDKMQARSPARHGRKSLPFLLSGIVYCGHCGQRMMGVTRHQTWRRKDGERAQAEYRYYQCQSRINRNQCDYRTIRADDVEEEAISLTRERLANVGLTTEVDGTSWLADDRAQSNARLKMLDRRLLDGVQRAANGGLTLGQLRGGLIQLQAAKQALNERIRQTTDDQSARALLDANVHRFMNEWNGLTNEQRRELVKSIVSKVTVKDGHADVALV